MNNFFEDNGKHSDINIDINHFKTILSEVAGTYKSKKMISKMKEVYRDRLLLTDFLVRMKIDLKYLIELTYYYDYRIVTPQLAKELNALIKKYPNYPYWT